MTGGFWGSRKHLWTKNLINYTEEDNFCTLVRKNFTKDNISMYIHKHMTLIVFLSSGLNLDHQSLPANLSTFTFSSFLKHWSTAFACISWGYPNVDNNVFKVHQFLAAVSFLNCSTRGGRRRASLLLYLAIRRNRSSLNLQQNIK